MQCSKPLSSILELAFARGLPLALPIPFGPHQVEPWEPHKETRATCCLRDGGAYRDRTDDLKLAKLPLSQLS